MGQWQLIDRETARWAPPLELWESPSGVLAIRLHGLDLMRSDEVASVTALATVARAAISTPSARVLIGGLGLGYTLAAALEHAAPDATVIVVELAPSTGRWTARLPHGPAALTDARTRLLESDVRYSLGAPNTYDAILLDTDNDAETAGLSRRANEWLYSMEGLSAARQALRRGGALAVWLHHRDDDFAARAREAGLRVRWTPISDFVRGSLHHIALLEIDT
jgi:spermidine synthase